jgi:hypothetical protein
LKGFSLSEANSIGGNNTPAPIDKAGKDEFSTNCDFADFLGIHLALPNQKVN